MIIRQQSLPVHRLFLTALFTLVSRRVRRLWHLTQRIPVAVFAAVSLRSMRRPVGCFGKPSTCRTTADSQGDTVAARFGNHPRLILSEARSSLIPATTTL